MRLLLPALFVVASAALADGGDFTKADVVFLGEQHDNPVHHARQAYLVAQIAPTALVFEMLTPAQAARITPDLRADEAAMEAALGWNDSGWPDFAMYYPIFAAAPDAAVFGAAVPRVQARSLMDVDLADAFGPDAIAFGLGAPLPAEQRDAREALQAEAHCDALPPEMLPVMVDIQRLRDATLARVARDARQATGGPVVVITGNGHARTDWGAPAILREAEPGVAVFALGQGEAGEPPIGAFDWIEVDAPAVDRGDPCAAFDKG